MAIHLKLDVAAIDKILASSGEEIKLDLQKAVVEEFSKKYLKTIANEMDLKLLMQKAEEAGILLMKKNTYWSTEVAKKFQKELNDKLDAILTREILKLSEEYIQTRVNALFDMSLRSHITKRIDNILEKTVMNIFHERISKKD